MLNNRDKEHNTAQVAHALLQLKYDGDFDDALLQRYGITFENFHKLLYDLLLMCDSARTKYGVCSGFIDSDGVWLANTVVQYGEGK